MLVPVHNFAQSLWRNCLARSAVNRKDGGSSPPSDEIVLFCEKFSSQQRVSECCPNAHQEHSSSSACLNVYNGQYVDPTRALGFISTTLYQAELTGHERQVLPLFTTTMPPRTE